MNGFITFRYRHWCLALFAGLVLSGTTMGSITLTISGLAQSDTGPFLAGDPISVSFVIDSGTTDSWSAGTEFSPTQWSNNYPSSSVVVSSISSPSILNGPVTANSTDVPFANFQIWDQEPALFSIGSTINFFVADLGDLWNLRGVYFETTALPLPYVGTYTDPVAWLGNASGTYTTGLEGSFFNLTLWNGFTTGLNVSVEEISIVPEPSMAALFLGCGVIGLVLVSRRAGC